MNDFFTWQTLVTLGGAAIATSIVTQFVKGIFTKIPTQIVSYVIALVILVAATAATAQSATWGTWAILPLNAVIVSLSANGAFAAVSRAVSGTEDSGDDA